MIDSDRRPDSNRRPLLKSASTDAIISNHGPILRYSQIGVLSKLISIGPFTRSKFAIKNNCNDSFACFFYFFFCFLRLLFFVLCVFKAFSHSLILFRVKVRFRVRIMAMIWIRVRVRVKVRVRFR